jgi:hypothetical protein
MYVFKNYIIKIFENQINFNKVFFSLGNKYQKASLLTLEPNPEVEFLSHG